MTAGTVTRPGVHPRRGRRGVLGALAGLAALVAVPVPFAVQRDTPGGRALIPVMVVDVRRLPVRLEGSP